jgi:hypothetical protein
MKFTIAIIFCITAGAYSAPAPTEPTEPKPRPGVCSLESFQEGYDLAEKRFDSKWDKNCTTLTNELVEQMLESRPKFMAKCQKRGYYSGIDDIYKVKSEECFPDCKGVGKTIGLELGKAFCKGEEPSNELDTTCNAVEEASCSDAFFDYAYANCNEKRRVDDYSIFDSYSTYCQINKGV